MVRGLAISGWATREGSRLPRLASHRWAIRRWGSLSAPPPSPLDSAAAIPTAGPIAAAIQAAPGGDDGGFNNPYAAASGANPQQGGPYVGGQGVAPGIGAYPDSTNYPHSLTPPGSPSATPRPADSGTKGALASPDAPAAAPMKRRAGAPNLGYYQPSNRFIGIDAPNASAQNSMRGGPQGTALNLAGLALRRPAGQPAANPNAPAANAQTVSMTGGPTPVGQGLNPSGNLALAGGNSPGPNQFSSVPVPYPPNMPGDIRNQRVANAVRNPELVAEPMSQVRRLQKWRSPSGSINLPDLSRGRGRID